ncbi:MAG TPA: biotin transporter BioY [Candidatus Eisenbacteria bacterium]
MVLADRFRPGFAGPSAAASAAAGSSRAAAFAYDFALILAGSALIALSAQVAIPLPFSPVPVTGQTFGVLFVASLLGRVRGTAAVLAYLAEGAAGLPVFAGAAAGPAKLLGPTGGYLAGFTLGAYVCGWLAERGWDRTPLRATTSMILGNIAIFALALPWLARFVGASNVWALGFWPFIPGDIVKIGLAAALLPLGWKALGARGR